MFSQLERTVMGSPLPFGQSLLLLWPQVSALIAASLLVFTGAYIGFQRREIRT
ncbi:hypothetical protein [Sediminispirochaeta smaragdinae]|uniref:hypothetical protein n=1 Tax=Sediminispirochaeta smaragdinae TaxID=55206 RepID=UPI001FDF5D7D|nr:hypothetical protein [Sediminispirochaeta smaragdinae]